MDNQFINVCNPDHWVKNYSDELFRFAYFRTNNNELSQDLVQETFLSALKNLKNFRQESNEKTWLYQILKNKIIDHHRRNKKSEASTNETGETINSESFLSRFFRNDGLFIGHWKSENAPKEWSASADADLLNEEFMNLLLECLSYLPEKQAEVFRLKNMEECTTIEICKELQVSSSNLWVLIHRAKLQLRECLEKKGIANE